MKICPTGHNSEAEDYCDICGAEIPGINTVPIRLPPLAASTGSRSPTDSDCPICSTTRAATFCELCGYNFTTGEAPVEADSMKPEPAVSPVLAPTEVPAPATSITDPNTVPTRVAAPIPKAPAPRWNLTLVAKPPSTDAVQTIPFSGPEMLIGRSSKKRSISPQIDLLKDDAISHRHALIQQRDDGQLTITDLGSSNGTQVNGKELAPNQPHLLQSGDRIELGVLWSLLLTA